MFFIHSRKIHFFLTSNRLELHTVKIQIMNFFPNSQKLNYISVSHPVLNDKCFVIQKKALLMECPNIKNRDTLSSIPTFYQHI